MNCKIALGTVQFGLNYGITNSKGITPGVEVKQILDYYYSEGGRVLDTSMAYGVSEKVIGEYHNNRFKIITKLSWEHIDNLENHLTLSLSKLKVSKVYALMLNTADILNENPSIWSEMQKIKNSGKCNKIGFSLYTTGQLEILLDKNIIPDIVQLPMSVADRRFVPFLKRLKELGTEVHVRSVFLQGILLGTPSELDTNFKELFPLLTKMRETVSNDLLPGYLVKVIADIKELDYVVLGVNDVRQLKENFSSMRKIKKTNINEFDEYKISKKVVLPHLWKIKK
jgi:aryl-alcohol dehydrogenase-like predicted oxidoreductase